MPTNANVILTPATLPAGSCFASEQERLNAFAEHVSGVLPDTYSTVNVGSTAPQPNDRDKAWLRTNTDGSPDGLYFYYNGSWKRKHPVDPGFIGLWLGTPGDIDALDGGTAGTATLYAGPFWRIATEFAARFPLGVGTLPIAGAVAVGATGGEERVTLETKHLPTVLGRLKDPFTKLIGTVTGGGTNGENSGGAVARDEMSNVILGGTADTDKSHNNVPPYVGVYFIVRTIRTMYSI